MDDPDVKLLVFIVVAAGLAGAAWYFRSDLLSLTDAPVVIQPEAVVEEPPVDTGPMHPIVPPIPSESIDRELVRLPPLDDSDSYFLLALIELFGADVGNLLVNEALIDKFVATVDNLTRGHVAEKIRPVGRLPGAPVVLAAASDGPLYLSPDNYKRYDSLVNLVIMVDLEAVASTYRRFYPLFQKSYVRLGYPDAYFNDRVVEVIDQLLATPRPDEPIPLLQPHVLYEFADAELEALPSGQKLLLRMGREHATKIKAVLQEFRTLITQPPE